MSLEFIGYKMWDKIGVCAGEIAGPLPVLPDSSQRGVTLGRALRYLSF
jgi:hypothetical protein